MRILIDIGHPAHVHYFRNFIKIMKSKGHKISVSARDKEVVQNLLEYYNIDYFSRGKGGKSLFSKIFYILKADYLIYKKAKIFNPNVFLSFGSPYAAHVSKIMNKPHIAFDDTEHAKYEHMFYVSFTDVILTPSCFYKQISQKQIYFDSYMELCYLHKNYYHPSGNMNNKLNLKENEKYIVMRFVSWQANHDIGQKGIKTKTKHDIINLLKDKFKIFISSETKLPDDLQQYALNIEPHELHSVLANSYLYIGEGSTTASECSVLGTPSIYVNTLTVGYCKEQDERYGLCFHIKNDNDLIALIKILTEKDDLQNEWKEKRERMLKDKIDLTAFMVWFVENYPKSYKIMKEKPEYQYNFK